MPTVRKIGTLPSLPEQKRVAAYARVSRESDAMFASLSAQVSYYSELIQSTPGWEFAGVYADQFISGTSTAKRLEFQRLIRDCEDGKIDIILTKSISRFARNTVDLLATVRHLKELGVSVRFEREDIDSMSGDGELMLTILASFAQEEARSVSENIKWSVRKRMEAGLPWAHFRVYGYRWDGDQLVLEPGEADVVRRIYQNFLDGKSRIETAAELNADGYTTSRGLPWKDYSVGRILTDQIYTGDLLLQKTYRQVLTWPSIHMNRGELPEYLVQDDHAPCVSRETFDYVQEETLRRRELGAFANKAIATSCFTGKIRCPACGCAYVRSHENRYGDPYRWICSGRRKHGRSCPIGGMIPQTKLMAACCDVLDLDMFDEDVFLERVDEILVPERHTLEIHLKDGTIEVRDCAPTGHQDQWTPERRKEKAAYALKHPIDVRYISCFTSKIRCVQCGCNFHRMHYQTGGRRVATWRCSAPGKPCGTKGLREDALKALTAEVMGMTEFDEDEFAAAIDYLDVVSPSEIEFVFRDGHTVARSWTSPERKKKDPGR